MSILNHIDTCRRIWNGLVADSWHVGGERKGEGVEFACVEEGWGDAGCQKFDTVHLFVP